jgi:hypothetical protein
MEPPGGKETVIISTFGENARAEITTASGLRGKRKGSAERSLSLKTDN